MSCGCGGYLRVEPPHQRAYASSGEGRSCSGPVRAQTLRLLPPRRVEVQYPFSVRTWSRADYDQMFHLLKRLGFDTVMLWPVVEAIPMPLSDADARAVRGFRSTITDAQHAGLECWLVYCPAVTCRPEIAAWPWRERSLYAFRETARLDNPAQAEPWLAHRARLLRILNNADGYVTIDGDPGGYPGAKPVDFLRVFLEDRRTIDRWGTRPSRQKLIPWIWCGWGTKGVWQEPIEPFVQAELELLQRNCLSRRNFSSANAAARRPAIGRT